MLRMTWAVLTLVFAGVLADYIVDTQRNMAYGSYAALQYSGGTPSIDTYPTLDAEMIVWDDAVARIRVRPTNVTPPLTQPAVVPDAVFAGSEANASTIIAVQSPKYSLGIMFGRATCVRAGVTIFQLNDVVFEEQRVEFSTPIPTSGTRLVGFGEHDFTYFIDGATLSLWNTDNGTPWQMPMYGFHPFVLLADPAGVFSLILLLNAHAMRLTVDKTSMRFSAIGGVIDVWIIVGDSALDVVRRYHRLIGPAAVPPMWSLGVHQCRWGYRTLDDVKTVVQSYREAGIPLDAMWNDIDYMNDFQIFTTDPQRYPIAELAAFIQELQDKNQHYVQIIDPGVAMRLNYSVYESAVAAGALLMYNNSPAVNAVWPGWTVFPDFGSSQGSAWWIAQLRYYLEYVDLDGVWLDMNELGTFCAGHCPVSPGTPWNVNWSTVDWSRFNELVCAPAGCGAGADKWNDPSVNPLTNGNDLYTKTLDMTVSSSYGLYYSTKAFYANLQQRATYEALAYRSVRPFILTRSSFVGTGRYAAHWTGDNTATWGPREGGIFDSIQAVLAANLWGSLIVGADVGGFGGPATTEELIVRWYQLGSAAYTFLRNHRDLQGPAQEPYRFSEKAQRAIRTAIQRRYMLLPYIMTNLLESHYRGGPFLRHPSLEFYFDAAMYVEQTSVMVGSALLAIPVLTPGATNVTARVPYGDWYDLRTFMKYNGEAVQTLDAPLYGELPLLLRAGYAIPTFVAPALTVGDTAAGGHGLICALSDGVATGELWFDNDGRVLPSDVNDLNRLAFSCTGDPSSGTVVATIVGGGPYVPGYIFPPLRKSAVVTIVFPTPPNGVGLSFSIDGIREPDVSVTVQGYAMHVTLSRRDVDASVPFTLTWSTPSPQSAATETRKIVFAAVGVFVGMLLIIVLLLVCHRHSRRTVYDEALSTSLKSPLAEGSNLVNRQS